MSKFLLIPVMVLVLVACAPAAQPEPTTAPPTDVPATDVPPTDVPAAATTPEAAAEVDTEQETVAEAEAPAEAEAVADAPGASLPAWASIELTDANTGATFTLAEFAGQPVYVHMMATWCSNCRASQTRLSNDVLPVVGDDAVFVSIDVQSQLEASRLAAYTQENSFGWTFAVANNDLLNALAEDFGRTVANPPSTPHFVIYPDGSVSDLQTGSNSPDEVIALINGA